MPLRVRLIWSVVLALLAGIVLGGIITVWQARHSVSTEMDSALAVARRTVTTSIEDLSPGADPRLDLRRLIAAFDGDRHIRASLIGKGDETLLRSTVKRTVEQVPDWFINLTGVGAGVVDIELPPGASDIHAVRLETDPRNETLEVWNSLRNAALLVVVLCVSAGALIWWSISRALRPFARLSTALTSIGEGAFDQRITAEGIPEAKLIAAAFNRMAEDLAAARARNLVLYDRLLTAQEAERAEIARDLHDDIGPLLLAINIDASGVEGEAAQGDAGGVSACVQSIRDAVRQAQHHVRSMVNRLRPAGLAEFGIAGAIENLIEFWRPRHPDVRFMLDLPPGLTSFGDRLDITVFRIVQEGLNNALRHGRPMTVHVSLRCQSGSEGGVLLVEISDDGLGNPAVSPGFGLVGMRERIEAAGGTLNFNSAAGRGFAISARLPLRHMEEAALRKPPAETVT